MTRSRNSSRAGSPVRGGGSGGAPVRRGASPVRRGASPVRRGGDDYDSRSPSPLPRTSLGSWVRGRVVRVSRAAGFSHVVHYGPQSPLGALAVVSLLDAASAGVSRLRPCRAVPEGASSLRLVSVP